MSNPAGKPDNFFPLWIADYLADTTHLTTILHGAYLLLLIAYWRRQGPLPDDDELLRSMAKMDRGELKRARPVIANFFQIEGGRWHQKRADAELADARKRVEIAAEKGRRGGEAARGKSGRKPRDDKYLGNSPAIPKHAEINAQTIPSHLVPKEEQQSKKQQDAASRLPNGSDSLSPLDLQKSLFSTGVKYLIANGKPEAQARSMIGKWRKNFDDVAIIKAFAAAEAEGSPDPVAFIAKCLTNGRGNGHGNGSTNARQPGGSRPAPGQGFLDGLRSFAAKHADGTVRAKADNGDDD